MLTYFASGSAVHHLVLLLLLIFVFLVIATARLFYILRQVLVGSGLNFRTCIRKTARK
jgi:hypothetical protein